MITLTLPFPPSVNTYWRNIVYRGRPRTLISEGGRAYASLVHLLVIKAKASRGLKTRLSVEITARPPDARARDVDNLLKALLDSLTKANVWEDDGQIDELIIRRGEIIKGGEVTVRIKELDYE